MSFDINVGSNLMLKEVVVDPSWEGDGEKGKVKIYTDVNKSGIFPIATFNIQSNALEGKAKIELDNIEIYDGNFEEINVSSLPLEISGNTLNTLVINESVDNPKTFDSNIFGIFLIILLFSFVIYAYVRNKNKFKKNI